MKFPLRKAHIGEFPVMDGGSASPNVVLATILGPKATAFLTDYTIFSIMRCKLSETALLGLLFARIIQATWQFLAAGAANRWQMALPLALF